MKRFPQLLSLLLLAGCAAAPPAVEFTAADAAAIRDAAAKAVTIANTEPIDWAAYVHHYYADGATVHMAGMADVQGHDAIAAMLASFTGVRNFRMEIVDLDGVGDLAYVYGKAAMDVPGENGELATEHFRYIEVWRRQVDGTWQVIHDISNGDVTAQPQP